MVFVFQEIRRVLKDDGTLWLNLGDSYWGGKGQSGSGGAEKQAERNERGESLNRSYQTLGGSKQTRPTDGKHPTIKPKDLIGIPWRMALALQADGWYLRSDIVWAKPNPMPESVTDRPTKSHEYLFLLSKSPKYFYDSEAVKEPGTGRETFYRSGKRLEQCRNDAGKHNTEPATTRNRRDVWTINTKPFKGAHFAVMPEALVEPCVLAGTSEYGNCAVCGASYVRQVERAKPPTMEMSDRFDDGVMNGSPKKKVGRKYQEWLDTNPPTATVWVKTCECETNEVVPALVLDPFTGSGTVAVVANRLGRNFVGTELNPEYAEIARERITNAIGLLGGVEIRA